MHAVAQLTVYITIGAHSGSFMYRESLSRVCVRERASLAFNITSKTVLWDEVVSLPDKQASQCGS